MNNNMIITCKNENNKAILVVNKSVNANAFCELVKAANPNAELHVYNPNDENVPFEFLPDEVQKEVKDVLKAFDECHVEHCHSKLSVHTGWCLSAHYADDECVVGEYKANEVFTEEERIINYAESFHDFSPLYKGKRDYAMWSKVGYDWSVKFKMVNGNLEIA